MNLFNMIIVIGAALFLSISTIQADTPQIAAIPKVLPDGAPYVNNTASQICSSEPHCGWVRYSGLEKKLGVVHIVCICPQKQRCEYAEPSLASHTQAYHLYKCADKPPVEVLRPIGWST